jgi:ATP-binding cassette subfamily C (CFTR/MRP) protein 1
VSYNAELGYEFQLISSKIPLNSSNTTAILQITAPLVTRKILTQLEVANAYDNATAAQQTFLPRPKSVGYGIGLAFALFVMEMASSLFTYQGQQRGAVIGFSMRAAVSAALRIRIVVNR